MSTVRIPLFLCLALAAGCAQEKAASEALESVSTPTSDEPYVETTHSLVLDASSENMAVAYEAGLAACRNLSSEESSQCHVTTASISTGDWPSASFQMRVTPGGIDAIVNAVEEHGQVVRRTTTSLDLAKPIVDQAQRIAMLEQYLADLEVLRQNAANDVDAMIKVAKEMSATQSTLESVRGTHAHLMTRVQLDKLEVQISSDANHSFWAPIGRAFGDMGDDISDSVAEFISGVIYVLPWLIFFMFVLLFGRWVWKK